MENSIKNSKHIAKSAVVTGFATNKTADEKLKRNSKLRVAEDAVPADSRQCHTWAGHLELVFHRSR